MIYRLLLKQNRFTMKKILPLLALALSCPLLKGQVDYDGTYPWSQTTSIAPDNAVPGWFYNLGVTGLRVQLDPAAPKVLVVKHVFAGSPASAAGFLVDDQITGVNGAAFVENHEDGYGVAVFGARGPIGEFGVALDAAQGGNGQLSLLRKRGTAAATSVTLNVGTTYGGFSPSFPTNCPKSTRILGELLTYLRNTQNAGGYWEGLGGHENHVYAGLALLSDGSPASMTAAGKLATYYSNQTNGPVPAGSLSNWTYFAAAIYLSEYYHKTGQSSVLTKLNEIYGHLLASQYTSTSQIVPGYNPVNDPFTKAYGGWGHNPGFEGYGPFAMLTGQGALAFSLMQRVGVNVDRSRLDAAYDFLVKGTGANNYVWYFDGDGSSGDPNAWADPGRTGVAAIANWMSPYTDSVYATRAVNHASFMGDHPQSFPDTHGSPTIGMAFAGMGTFVDPASFRKLMDNNKWWFTLAHTPEGNFYYQPNRDNSYYGPNPRFVASSITALIFSLPKRNLLISERVAGGLQASFSSQPTATGTSAITMTATTQTSSNGSVEYLFTETSGNPGATNSAWQSSPAYTDSGLNAATQYTYNVTVRDTGGNVGAASAQASATTQGGTEQEDRFNVNLYSFGEYSTANQNKATLEAGESAGVGSNNVTGWQNIELPFGLGSPMSPVFITSSLGLPASFTLKDVRNGWTYDSTPNTNVTGGNADLMNSHANGTEDPYDGSNLFDMEVTGIPYNVYDLIVYLGANQAQFGDGTAKLVINGGPQQSFTLTSGEFSGFTEITNATTPGNYIVFRGLRNPSLTLQVWGNGFNHIGPTGFQIVKDISGVIPPGPAASPNPTNASVGHAANTDLSWTGGLDATSRNVYFGTNPSPGASELRGNQTATTYDPGNLANGTYYWRIDEVNADGTTPGPVWSFSVGSPAKAFRPMPWNGMTAVATNVGSLQWVTGASATASSHDVYFGTDSTPDASEFIGNQSGTTYNPGPLSPATTYYWRIDQVNAQGTTTGDVWSFTTPNTSSNKVKIFIMAGQSNMEGQGEMNPAGTPGTLQTIYNNDPVTYAHLKTGGNWTVRDDAWIWYKREGTTLVHGGLTAGYGVSSTTIGPELQFGHVMGDYFGQKVLLIKTAWGGKSLRTDFRPPSSGWSKDQPVTNGDEGFYFKQMLDDVVAATANLQTYFPTHNPADGYEIAGFAWHQGWNDRVTPAFAAEYEVNMARFIRDVRSAVGVPAMPFVIATTGMDGNPDFSEVELAQLQMENFTAYPDFNGNVAVVDTQSFWFPVSQSPTDQGYHWNRNAGSYYQIGNAIAQEMRTLVDDTGDVAVALNVDFGADNGGAAENYTGVGVAPDTGTTWNHFNSASQGAAINISNAPLLSSTGVPSGISLSTASSNQFAYNAGTANDLLVDYLFNISGTSTVNLTGLAPNVAFSLYLYGNGDQPTQASTFTLSAANGGATGTTTGSDRSNINNTFVRLDGTADGSGNLSFTWTAAPSTTQYGVLNGLQLLVQPASDTVAPALTSINDNRGGGSLGINTLVNYTVTFSEDMDAGTVSAADFGNAGTSAVTIGTVTEISPGVFTVPVTPTNAGTLRLRINAGAGLNDTAGNSLVTTSALNDDTTLTVTVPNTAPVAVSQNVVTSQNTSKLITLSANDAEGNPLTYSIVTQPSNGTLGGTPPNVTYDPSANYIGTDSFTFKANDGTLDSAAATVTITVTANGQITWGAATTITSASNIQSAGVSNLAGANFGITTGTTTLVPAAETGSVDVEFRSLRSGQNVTLSNGINVAASADWGNWGFAAGNSTVAGNFGTVLDSNLGIETGAPASPSATFTLSGLTIGTQYQVQFFADSTGSNSQTITDGGTMNSLSGQFVTGTFTADATTRVLTVTRNTDFAVANALTIGTIGQAAPTLVSIVDNQGGGPITVNTPVTYTVTFSTDMDHTTVSSTDFGNAGTSAVTIGTVTESSPGVFSVPVTPTSAGTLRLRINAGAVLNGASGSALNTTVAIPDDTTLTVTAPNTAPVADTQNVITPEDTQTNITLTGSDAEGSVLTYTVVSQPARGTLSGTAPNLTYTPAPNDNGSLSFTFKVNDGTLDSAIETVWIAVTAVNDAPVANTQNVITPEDTQTNITLSGSDTEGSALTYTVVTPPSRGTLSGTAPNLTYTPAPNDNGSLSLTFKVNDGTVDSAIETVWIAVTAVNDAPVATPQSVITPHNTNKTITLGGSDVEGSALTYTVVTQPTRGSLSGSGSNLNYTPTTGTSGPDSFTYKVNDGSLDSATVTVSITVSLPLPWTNGDIGTGMLAGSVTTSSGTFTQAGSGTVGSTSDKLHFTYQTLTGDGEIIARISNLQSTGTSSRVGVMIRDTLAENSKSIYMGMSATGTYRWIRRTTTGGTASTTNSSTGTVPNTWVRLVRSGTTITAYKSTNGTSWTQVGSTTNTTFASTCYIGLAVASGSTTTLNTSQFSNVTVTP
jgi:Family of unknown function (DUF6288)/Carbohydrate esterase, sialic acid-specific acetylesterase/Bacterial Ig domain